MKKLILALLAAGSAMCANAQSGSWLLYGNVNFDLYHLKDASPETKQIGSIMPGVGYQFNENWTVGLAGGYALLSTKEANSDKRLNASEFRVGPFLRYTKNISPLFSCYTQLDLGYLGGKTAYDGTELPGTKFNGFYAGITPAIMVHVHNGFALNFGFGGLSYASRKFDGADNANSDFKFTFGQQVNIGVSKNFGGHKMHAHREPMDETRKLNTKDDE
jgi:hypothetical protein